MEARPEATIKGCETNIHTGEARWMPEMKYSAIKSMEKRILVLTVILFAAGIALTIGSFLSIVFSTTSALEAPVEDALEYSKLLQGTIFGFQGLMVVGFSLMASAVLLAIWWENVQRKRIKSFYESWLS
jgi:formate/nitrite transporter FocA (FNT family)